MTPGSTCIRPDPAVPTWQIREGTVAGELTVLLAAADGNGDDDRLDRAFSLVYHELKMIAHRALGRAGGATMGTTGLVHEAYAKLAAHDALDLRGRKHFFALCARAMRQIVVDHARRRQAEKRGAGLAAVSLSEHEAFDLAQPDSVVALDAALVALEQRDPRLVELLHLRLFAGLDLGEIAPLLGLTVRQLQRDWQRARIWIAQALAPDEA